MKGEKMIPEIKRLEYLTRLNNFIEVITEQAKQDRLNQNEFLSILIVKAKCMLREARENRSKGINLNNMLNNKA
jgi:hypothetical protein